LGFRYPQDILPSAGGNCRVKGRLPRLALNRDHDLGKIQRVQPQGRIQQPQVRIQFLQLSAIPPVNRHHEATKQWLVDRHQEMPPNATERGLADRTRR
jgi:hypothetical protein